MLITQKSKNFLILQNETHDQHEVLTFTILISDGVVMVTFGISVDRQVKLLKLLIELRDFSVHSCLNHSYGKKCPQASISQSTNIELETEFSIGKEFANVVCVIHDRVAEAGGGEDGTGCGCHTRAGCGRRIQDAKVF